MIALGFGLSGTQPDFQERIDTLGCETPGQTEYEQIEGVFNWNSTSGTKLYDCSNVITFGHDGGCGQVSPDGCDYFYGAPGVQIGWFFYASDVISRSWENAGAMLDLSIGGVTQAEYTLFGQSVDLGFISVVFALLIACVSLGGILIGRGISG